MGLFKDSNQNHTCPTHSLTESATDPFLGGQSFHHFNTILSGSCAGLVWLVIGGLLAMHALHLSKPNEQIKIMKIGCLLPSYALISFLSVCFPSAAVYIQPWLEVFQAVALGSFFLLMCEFVSPSPEQRDVFFSALQVRDKHAPNGVGGGLVWYRRRWIMIFQYPVVASACAVATDITQGAGVYCQYVSKPYFAHIWISIAQNASLAIAVIAVLKFYLALKVHLAHHQPLAKFLCFKLIVFLTFVQRILFWILTDAHALNPTSKLTYADLNIGIPNLITCVEMVPLSLFFHYAYSYRPYLIRAHSVEQANTGVQFTKPYQGGFLGIRAWLEMVNPKEIFSAIAFAFNMATEQRRAGLEGGASDESASYDLLARQRRQGRH